MKSIFVCFTGTDGSGKSTLADHTYEALVQRNMKVRKVYGRYQPLLTKYLMRIGKRIFLDKADRDLNYDNYLQDKRMLFRRLSLLIRIYIGLVILEYYMEVLFKLIIPYRLGYSIVSDRYVYDTVINDIAVDMNLSVAEVRKIMKGFWSFVPKPDLGFLVHVPEEVALKRKSDIPSASYLKVRNEFYRNLVMDEQLISLDGTASISQLRDYVMDRVSKLLSNG